MAMLSRSERLLKLAAIYEFQCFAAEYAEELKNALQGYLGINISSEAWVNWVEANKSSLAEISGLQRWYDLEERDMEGIFAQTIYVSGAKLINKWVIISRSQNIGSNYELSQQTMLKGTSGIPNLYLSAVTTKDDDVIIPDDIMPLNVSHYAWVYEALGHMTNDRGYVGGRRDIIEFIRENKSALNKLRQHFKSQPTMLGGGADGVAFDIGGNNVLKIFGDEAAYEKAKEAIKRLHGNPELARTEAMIYDTGKLGEINGNEIFYYIMEKLKTLPIEIYNPLTTVLGYIRNYVLNDKNQLQRIKMQINHPSKAPLIRNVVKRKAEQIAEKILDTNYYHVQEVADLIGDTGVSMKDNWFELLVEEVIMKYVTGRTDLHVGNIGITENGEFRYFDPSYSGVESRTINLG